MKPLFLPFPGSSEGMALTLARACGGDLATLNYRRFPDGESYFRLERRLAGRDLVLVCSLDDPDARTTLLRLVAAEARQREVRSIGLVAPYLAYMRQDKSFHPGEPVSARLYAAIISECVNWLVTVDPHLHRIHDLGEVYRIPTTLVHATAPMAVWIRKTVPHPVLVGPDAESRQWVAAIAAAAGAPFVVLKKERLGDRQVRITAGDLGACAGHTAVLVDDVVSSGRTLIEAAACLRAHGIAVGPCVAVHGLASGEALAALAAAKLQLTTADTTSSPTAGFSVAPALAAAVRERLALD